MATQYTALKRVPVPPAFPPAGTTTVTEIPVEPPISGWREAVVSWNVKNPVGGRLRIEASASLDGRSTDWYVIADWCADPSRSPRQSVKDQADADGDVDTDTLVLKKPTSGQLLLRVSQETFEDSVPPALSLVTVSFAAPERFSSRDASSRKAWGTAISVPEKSQMNYPNGSVLCSPTSISMLLSYWAKDRSEWAVDVPEVAAGVYDPVWKGTGNWPFNTAFAGSLSGLRGYVTRLNDIAELETLVSRGVPVATSVSYGLLKGKGKRDNDDGHLVVVRGFDPRGDLLINDPGKGTEVRQTYRRDAFLRAWKVSGNTIYLVHPEGRPLPKSSRGTWLAK